MGGRGDGGQAECEQLVDAFEDQVLLIRVNPIRVTHLRTRCCFVLTEIAHLLHGKMGIKRRWRLGDAVLLRGDGLQHLIGAVTR